MILTNAEGAAVCHEVAEMIRLTGNPAVVLRKAEGERLFGSDPGEWSQIEETAVELLETPPIDLGKAIDAKANLLPGSQARPADRLTVAGTTYTVQTLKPMNLFGHLTHQVAELVIVVGG